MEKISFVMSMIGKVVRIDRGGPESRVGKLVAVHQDYVVLQNAAEGIIYYSSEHIKSITVDGMDSGCDKEGDCSYQEEHCFLEVLRSLKYRSIQINRGGPEKLEGVLTSVNEDRLLLVVKNEIVTVFIFHVRNVSLVSKKSDCDDDKKDDKGDKGDKGDKDDKGDKGGKDGKDGKDCKDEKDDKESKGRKVCCKCKKCKEKY